MKPVLVAPEARLDRVEFDPGAETREHVIHLGHYTCPRCGKVVEFKTADFRHGFRRSDLTASNLPPEVDRAYSAFRPLDSKLGESCLDFPCPGCQSPVRLIFEPWEFAMGAYAFTITAIVEDAI